MSKAVDEAVLSEFELHFFPLSAKSGKKKTFATIKCGDMCCRARQCRARLTLAIVSAASLANYIQLWMMPRTLHLRYKVLACAHLILHCKYTTIHPPWTYQDCDKKQTRNDK